MVTDLTGADHEITVVDGWVAFAGTVVNDAEGRNAPGELHVTVYATDRAVLAGYDEGD